MADKRISQLIERVDIANNDVLPIVASGATTTNKVTISTIQDWMQENLDVGVTSVGITLGSSGTDVNVSGSPITTSGNITINIPTASASNRGLLSSADWSTFNGKQNSITLTTSGTSGAATLVGSTLNIPNYSTGVANAYVPYVGAIGSVTLGYNSLSASQINIDGASPTGGSYLGFKHSNSVNTGTSGYTSMYTFGTNTIAFKSLSGGDSKDFSFSMVGITPNVAGGRQYTLPDASGTLALTSDLSGYVTLGTAQTITAQKTFTTSGSSDTLIVNHTSGSGIALNISKAGNGEGLRVAKTSGTGNAVTITGGLLSAEAATLTGALNGTSASFSGNVTSTGTGLNPSLRLTNTTASTGTDWHLYSLNNGNLGIYNNTVGAYSLQIASTGAATFSSSVTVQNGSTITILQPGNGNGSNIRSVSNGDFRITTGGTTDALTITNGGNVGIGTASPSAKLHVNNGTNLNVAINTTTVDSVTTSRISSFNDAVSATVGLAINGTPLVFQTEATERMRITSTGNVGIGTTTAASALSGDARVLAIVDNSTANVGSVRVYGGGTATSLELYGGSSAVGLFGSTNHPMVFSTNSTERMRITSGGAVECTGTIKTGNPSGSSAQAFKVGSVTTTTDSFFGSVLKMEINGVVYNIMIAEPPL